MSEGVHGGSPQTKGKSCCFGLLLEVSEPESTSFSKVGAHIDFEQFDAMYPTVLAVHHAVAAKTFLLHWKSSTQPSALSPPEEGR